MYVVVTPGNPSRQLSKAGRPSNLQCGQVTRSSAVNEPTPRCFSQRPRRSRVWASPFRFPRLLLVLCAADVPWRIGGGSFPHCYPHIPIGTARTLAPPATLAAPAHRCHPRTRSLPLRRRLSPPHLRPPGAPAAAAPAAAPARCARGSRPPPRRPRRSRPADGPAAPPALPRSRHSSRRLCGPRPALSLLLLHSPVPLRSASVLPPPPAPPRRGCGRPHRPLPWAAAAAATAAAAAATAPPPPVSVVTAASVAHDHFCFSMNALLWRCFCGESMHSGPRGLSRWWKMGQLTPHALDRAAGCFAG